MTESMSHIITSAPAKVTTLGSSCTTVWVMKWLITSASRVSSASTSPWRRWWK